MEAALVIDIGTGRCKGRGKTETEKLEGIRRVSRKKGIYFSFVMN
jgi:hypothetical protein